MKKKKQSEIKNNHFFQWLACTAILSLFLIGDRACRNRAQDQGTIIMTVPIDYVYKHKRRTFSATLYSAALRFTVEGKEYQMHFNIGKDAFESFAPGDSIRIKVPFIHPQYATLVEKKLVKATP